MIYKGFDSYGPHDVAWDVYHNCGTTRVKAPSEAIAIQRFLAKYPDRDIKKVVKK